MGILKNFANFFRNTVKCQLCLSNLYLIINYENFSSPYFYMSTRYQVLYMTMITINQTLCVLKYKRKEAKFQLKISD